MNGEEDGKLKLLLVFCIDVSPIQFCADFRNDGIRFITGCIVVVAAPIPPASPTVLVPGPARLVLLL